MPGRVGKFCVMVSPPGLAVANANELACVWPMGKTLEARPARLQGQRRCQVDTGAAAHVLNVGLDE